MQRTLKLVLPVVLVQIPLLHFPSHVRIMTELAFTPFVAMACLEIRAQHGLRIDSERHLLRLHGLEQRRFLLAPLLLLELLLRAQLLLLLLSECLSRLSRDSRLRLDLGDLLLHLGRFVFLFLKARISGNESVYS